MASGTQPLSIDVEPQQNAQQAPSFPRRSFGLGFLTGVLAVTALASTSLFSGRGASKFAAAPGTAPFVGRVPAATSTRGGARAQSVPRIHSYQQLPAVPLRPRARLAGAATTMQLETSAPSEIEKDMKLTPAIFKQLDVDASGSISVDELRQVFGQGALSDINALMRRADLDGNGELDYAEYERLMNMQKFGDKQGGNLYVRNAINLGLLKPDSILADGQAAILVGNKGFDPFSCATSLDALLEFREAELKHGRLAMLAAAGWPISELAQGYLSKAFGAPDLLAAGEKAPSLLNGGLDRINPIFFMAVIVFSATVESTALKMDRKSPDWVPGDLGFDPLNLYNGKAENVKRDLELKELNNGRLAMIAITTYALQEYFEKGAVVELSPALFKSIL